VTPLASVLTGFVLAPLFAATLAWLAAVITGVPHANAVVIGGALLGSATFPPFVGRVIAHYGVNAAAPAILSIAVAALALSIVVHRMTGLLESTAAVPRAGVTRCDR
jgi:hypothetical protein